MKGGSFTISTTLVGRKSWIQFLSIRKLIYKVQLRGVGARIDTQCEPLLLTLDISILYFSLYFLANFLNVMRHSCFFDCFYTAALTAQSGWLTPLIHVTNRHQSFQVIDVQAAILNRGYSGFLVASAPIQNQSVMHFSFTPFLCAAIQPHRMYLWARTFCNLRCTSAYSRSAAIPTSLNETILQVSYGPKQ